MSRVIVLILCLASAAGIAGYTYFYSNRGEPTAVYVVTQRPPEPKPKPAAVTNIDPNDRVALARALQRELKRVGCYSGEITGVWTTSSRMAMKSFTERVNATLPVDAPDPVLLSLVQGHHDVACVPSCAAGQAAADGGACTPGPVAARDSATDSARDKASPSLPEAGAAAALALTPAAKPPLPAAKTGAVDEARPAAAKPAPAPREARAADKTIASDAPPAGPVPAEGMREKRPRRSDQTATARPPKVVRDVLRALGFK
jgi:hypothetical protein